MSPRKLTGGAAAVAVLLLVAAGASSPSFAGAFGAKTEYTVLAADGVDNAAAAAAIERAGGKVLETNEAIGMFRVETTDAAFVNKAAASPSLAGAAHRSPIGRANPRKIDPAESATATAPASTQAAEAGLDPLDSKLWGLKMVKSDKARKVTPGDRRVTVGILDTGVDASNPDIAQNFSWDLSRNFARDLPEVDGPCEVPSCLDPVGTDDAGHGTHVAGTIGAAANGTGVSGVAPNVTLVELKGGQDSGFFFLEPVVNALVHAGNAGLDVVNMSFFVDPWLFNCTANPADSPAEQAEQRTIIAGMFRALRYAHSHGVTLVAALGNEHDDLGHPRTDVISPDFPGGTERPRQIDNKTCWSLPTEGPHVIGVSALGPSQKKSDFSNYGTEQISVSAPGGWFRDGFGTPTFRTNENLILSSYPKKVLQEEGRVDANGNVTPGNEGAVFKDCTASGQCGYYAYLQGTSMASPHAAGVAALIVSKYGRPDRDHPGGLTLKPNIVESILVHSAAEHACPNPPLQTYTNEGRPEEFNALCEGNRHFNGFYGHGIVDAFAAVTIRG